MNTFLLLKKIYLLYFKYRISCIPTGWTFEKKKKTTLLGKRSPSLKVG